MKFLKWLLIGVGILILLIGVGIVALVYLVDWNDFKETIQNQTRKHTGRELVISGDLSPSVFPWAGISIGEISLANAEGFGDEPFARIGSADVKVEVLPLLRKVVNIRTVELNGLNLNLQRAADGSTNWDDLLDRTSTTTTTEDDTTTEVEGSAATIAALAVGGIDISDANVSWLDVQSGTDARLSNFNLQTGAIELEQPFDLSTDFTLASDSMDLNAAIKGSGEVTVDLANQVYSLNDFKLTSDAKGASLPGGELNAKLSADIMAQLGEQQVAVKNLSLSALGIKLNGAIDVTDLDTEPNITGQLSTDEFNPRDMFEKLGIEAPVTADPDVLGKASMSLAITATPAAAALNDLTIKLDDTTFSGSASVPSLAATIPPLRFTFGVDAIDLDRYLPPPVEGDEAEAADESNADAEAAATDGDAPIELPMDLLRELDVDGEFSVGSVKVSNLTTTDIVIPVKAKDGVLGVEALQALLYEGKLSANAKLDATADIPVYGVDLQLNGIQAEPLLGDLLQDDSFLSGKGEFAMQLDTTGNSVNALTGALNGKFNTAFNDGSINGINLGYQIRRAKAALTGKKLDENAEVVKTDFSSLTVSGIFTDGVMTSDDLDMRSPLLRIDGAGKVDLPGEQVDYTLNTLITGSSQGQGGKDLESLKGVKLAIPIRGSFDELANDFAGVILQGMKDNISGNLKNQAKALADQEAAKLKAQAKEAEAKLKAEAKEKLKAQEAEAKEKLKAEAQKAADKVKDKLKGLLK